MMIILVNRFLSEEPEVTTFETRVDAEMYIKENLCYNSGKIFNYDAYEGIELIVNDNGTLSG